MCDARTEQVIRDMVESFVQSGYMFTCYDVTKSLRKAGEKVCHNDVKNIVEDMFDNGNMGQYVRDTKDVGAKIPPFVYFSSYSDINNYDPTWVDTNPNQSGISGVNTSTATSTPSTPAATSTPTSSVTPVLPADAKMVTNEGRLQIPINMVRSAGFTPHQKLCVSIDAPNSKLVIASTSPSFLTVCQVAKDGRIRLPRCILNQITTTGNIFKVEKQNDEIVVAPY